MKHEIYEKHVCNLCGNSESVLYSGTVDFHKEGFVARGRLEKGKFGTLVVVFDFGDEIGLKSPRVDLELCPNCARELDIAICQKISELKGDNYENH